MRFSVLASGSSGNSCYIETSRTRILIDAGLSCKELIRRLKTLKIEPDSIDALLVTHEHHDHIKGAGPFVRRFNLPLLINNRTFRKASKRLGRLPTPVIFNTGDTITVGDLELHLFTKCHDAADPVGVLISFDGIKLGLATDLGKSTAVVRDRLSGCDALILEFNHDTEMLEKGPYPLDLKRRIRGPEGHLSNVEAAGLLDSISHKKLRYVVLAHLSEVNNNKEKAMQMARATLDRRGLTHTQVVLSFQDRHISMIDLG